MSSEQSLTDLPSNILVEILTRLPLRTLIVSRSVCKTFLSLTTPNPHFIDLHSSNAAQILVFQFGGWNNPSFLLRMADPELDYAAIENSDLKPLFHLPKMGVDSLGEEYRFYIGNSCNGLVYFLRNLHYGDDRSLVCNPVTNEHIIIPGVDLEFKSSMMWLGFSPSTNQYKVLRISSSEYPDSVYRDPVEVAAHLFVIGSDSWRDIDATQMGKNLIFWNLCPTLIKGHMYWHLQGWTELASFDFEREKFGEVALPPEFQKYQSRNEYYTCIGVLGDCLCVSCNDSDAHCVYLWVMRKQNSWTKEFVFDTVGLTGKPILGWFKPLQFLRNGEVLLLMKWIENDIACYDPKTKTLRYFGLLKQFKLDVTALPLTPNFIPLKDTLKVDKVMNGYVRPRSDENALSEEGDFGTTNLLSRNCPRNLKKIQNIMRGMLDCFCFGN